MLVQMIPKRITRCLFVLKTRFFKVSCFFFFFYLNELPLVQFAVIFLVRNEVICFSTFFHTFKNFYSPSCELLWLSPLRLQKVDFCLIHSDVQTSQSFFQPKFYQTGNRYFRLFQHLENERQGQSTEDLPL